MWVILMGNSKLLMVDEGQIVIGATSILLKMIGDPNQRS